MERSLLRAGRQARGVRRRSAYGIGPEKRGGTRGEVPMRLPAESRLTIRVARPVGQVIGSDVSGRKLFR